MSQRLVTRGDIEAKLGEIQDSLTTQAEQARSKLLPAGIAAAVLLVLIAYLLGRRRGKKSTTIVEIRRV